MIPLTDEHAEDRRARAPRTWEETSPVVAANVGAGRSIKSVPTDEELLSEYRHGNRESFTALVHRYQRELFHFLIRFLGDRSAAEDVFQETFLQVHRSRAEFDASRRFRPWLFAIAANKAKDRMRAQARRPTVSLDAAVKPGQEEPGTFARLMPSAPEAPGEQLEREELRAQVDGVVALLPEHLREILLLSYFHGFPYKQVGEILRIPLGTVKSRLHAAVVAFARQWHNLQEREGRASPSPAPSKAGPVERLAAAAGHGDCEEQALAERECLGAHCRALQNLPHTPGRLHFPAVRKLLQQMDRASPLAASPDLVQRTLAFLGSHGGL